MTVDYFGYLDRKESYEFTGGLINVVDDFDAARKWIEDCKNKDGFVYPPIQVTKNIDLVTLQAGPDVPNTTRPALLHRLPPSHALEIFNGASIVEQRKGPSAFVMHLLSVLSGYRLQFYDWWFDGRIPMDPSNDIQVDKEVIEDFLSHCYDFWKSLNADNKKRITNLLYMYSRSIQYEWDWERFAVDYMVLDGIWRLSCDLGVVKNSGRHAGRIRILCETYGIPMNDDSINKIVNLRNSLFHETLWGAGQPCSYGDGDTSLHPLLLRKLIMRLIPAVFSYRTAFINTGWWYFGRFEFSKAT